MSSTATLPATRVLVFTRTRVNLAYPLHKVGVAGLALLGRVITPPRRGSLVCFSQLVRGDPRGAELLSQRRRGRLDSLDRFGHFCGAGVFRSLFFDHQRSVTVIAGTRRMYVARPVTDRRDLYRKRSPVDHSTAAPGESARTPGKPGKGRFAPPQEPRPAQGWAPTDRGPAPPRSTPPARERRCVGSDGRGAAAGAAPSTTPPVCGQSPRHTPYAPASP